MKQIQLTSGEFYCSLNEPTIISTLVGVCVCVCIWDKRLKKGGMCHFRLPRAPRFTDSSVNRNDFGNISIRNLLKKMKYAGSSLSDLSSWVLGGGHLNEGDFIQSQKIGLRNLAVTFEMLAQLGPPIVGISLGGFVGRQIRFNTLKGTVDYRLIQSDLSSIRKKNTNQLINSVSLIYVLVNNSFLEKFIVHFFKNQYPFAHVNYFNKMDDFLSNASNDKPCIYIVEQEIFETNAFSPSYLNITPTILLSKEGQCSLKQYSEIRKKVGMYIFTSNISAFPLVLESVFNVNNKNFNLNYSSLNFQTKKTKHTQKSENNGLILIGSSTGGIEALEYIFNEIKDPMPPICVVQHIPIKYYKNMIERFNQTSNIKVVEALDGQVLFPSTIYIAPSEKQLKLNQLENESIIIEIIDAPPMNGFAPSVDFMFNSALKIKNRLLICFLLSGMGNDGAQGLKKLKERGAITLIQDEKSSVVFGMAREAKKIGAECKTLPLSRISAYLHEILKLHLYKMQNSSVEYRKNDAHMEISKERI